MQSNIKLSQLVNRENAENKTRRLIPDRIFFFKKALYEVKASGQHLSFNIF